MYAATTVILATTNIFHTYAHRSLQITLTMPSRKQTVEVSQRKTSANLPHGTPGLFMGNVYISPPGLAIKAPININQIIWLEAMVILDSFKPTTEWQRINFSDGFYVLMLMLMQHLLQMFHSRFILAAYIHITNDGSLNWVLPNMLHSFCNGPFMVFWEACVI